MSVTVHTFVGPVQTNDGVSDLAPRLERTGAQVVQELHGQLYEQTKRGNLFTASNLAAGVAPGTAISTTPPFTLFNPASSPMDLVVLLTVAGYVSGTLGAGVLAYTVNTLTTAAAVTGGTSIVPKNNKLGGGVGQGLVFTGATLPATPAIFRPFANLGASLASTAVQPWQIVDDVKGSIVVAPGCAISIQGIAAAGSTPLMIFGMAWEEVPV